MNERERFNVRRLFPLIGILAVMMGSSAILCYFSERMIDEWWVILGFTLLIWLVLVYALEYMRRRGEIGNHVESRYVRILIGFSISALLTVGCSFFPAFFRPLALITLVLYAFSNELISCVGTIFYAFILALNMDGTLNEYLGYFVVMVIVLVLAKSIQEAAYRKEMAIILFCIQLIVPQMVYYWNYKQITTGFFLWGFLSSALVAAFVYFLYKPIKEVTEKEEEFYLGEILEENFSEVKEVKNYSVREYVHARRVSRIASDCAKLMGYNVDLCAAAGFYYRLGRRIGAPYVENGVKRAKELCFSKELVQILMEYYGEQVLPSTPESALVHMIDSLLIRMELLEESVGKSRWNQEIVVIQTMNDLSATGVYDKSGISMNQFLKIREILSKEDIFR